MELGRETLHQYWLIVLDLLYLVACTDCNQSKITRNPTLKLLL